MAKQNSFFRDKIFSCNVGRSRQAKVDAELSEIRDRLRKQSLA
jgi:hypothetical protein